MNDEAQALQAVQNLKSNLIAQLNELTLAEQRLINGNSSSPTQPAPLDSGSLGLSVPQPAHAAPQFRGPQSATQLSVSMTWGQGAGPPVRLLPKPGQTSDTGATREYSKLATSLAALAQVQQQQQQQQQQNGRRTVHSLALPESEVTHYGPEMQRLAQQQQQVLHDYGPRSAGNLPALSGSIDPWANLHLHQQQMQQQMQHGLHSAAKINLRMHHQQVDMARSLANPRSTSSSQLPMNNNAVPPSSQSGPLVLLQGYTPSSATHLPILTPSTSLHNSGPNSLHNNFNTTAVLLSQGPPSTPLQGPAIAHWVKGNTIMPLSALDNSPHLPVSAPTTLQSCVSSTGLKPHQPNHLLHMHQPIGSLQGSTWPGPLCINGVTSSQVMDGPPSNSLRSSLQATTNHVSAPLFQASLTGPNSMTDQTTANLQQQLGALGHALQVAGGSLGGGSTSGTHRGMSGIYPGTRHMPTSTSSTGSAASSKRSGASRRRKAKMYQALNAMVQAVVESGVDQEVAESAASAAAATLKGGVPNLHGGSAACASVVQAVFHQRLQQQMILKQATASNGGSSNGHNGNNSNRMQPLMQHLAMLQNSKLSSDTHGGLPISELILESADDGDGVPAVMGNTGSFTTVSRQGSGMPADWQAAYQEALAMNTSTAGSAANGADSDVNDWANLLQKLLQADMTETSVSSPTAHNSGAVLQQPFGEDVNSDDEGGLEAALEMEELSLLNLGVGSEALMGGMGIKTTAPSAPRVGTPPAARGMVSAPNTSNNSGAFVQPQSPLMLAGQNRSPSPTGRFDPVLAWPHVPLAPTPQFRLGLPGLPKPGVPGFWQTASLSSGGYGPVGNGRTVVQPPRFSSENGGSLGGPAGQDSNHNVQVAGVQGRA